MLDVKDAVKKAKTSVAELFGDEGLRNLALEEIEHDDQDGAWLVTVGFFRPWNAKSNALTSMTGFETVERTYRVVTVRDDGEILSIKIREVQH